MYRCPGAHHWTQPKSAQNRAVYISQGAMTQWRNICRTHAELTQSGYESYGAYRTYTHAHIHQSMHLQAQIRPATAGTSNSTHHSTSCANATLEGSALQEMAVSLRRLVSARQGEAITVVSCGGNRFIKERVEDRRGRDQRCSSGAACVLMLHGTRLPSNKTHTMPPTSMPPCDTPLPYNNLI